MMNRVTMGVMTAIMAVGTTGCPTKQSANVEEAGVVSTGNPPPPPRRAPKENPPPLATKNAEATKLETELTTLPVYAPLWDAAHRKDLEVVLTAVAECLVGEENDPEGKASLPESIAKAVDGAKAMDVVLKVTAIVARTGALPRDFAERTRTMLATMAAEPRRGLWSPTKTGTPRDIAAVAVILNPSDADVLREFIAARKGGPFGWEDQAKPLRPYLTRERVALERLAEIGKLTSEESDRLAALKRSRWSNEYAASTSIAELLSTYKDNEVRADSKWKGHGVEVTATVKTVKKDATNSIYAVLGTGRGIEAVDAQCQVGDRYAERVARWSKGDKVTVRAEVKGMILSAVMLGDCEPVE